MHQASPRIVESIVKWMETFVEKPHPTFGNMPPCPYARQFRLQNKVNIVECKNVVWDDCKNLLLDHEIAKFKPLLGRVTSEDVANFLEGE